MIRRVYRLRTTSRLASAAASAYSKSTSSYYGAATTTTAAAARRLLSSSSSAVSDMPSLAHGFNDSQGILQTCQDLRASVQALNDKYKGPLESKNAKNTMFPFVFLLGNHSSGKSSFINYLLNRRVQVSGVAPTDDTFTVIAPGQIDQDRDGPALIGDPEMGFASLRLFGPSLIHKTQLKVRKDIALKDFMVVDTPGMIDSPTVRSAVTGTSSPAYDRGYDFEKVVKWYAARADVILLFFDPDKPGTTGETLTVLTNALSGMDHKLHIILNKADQFRQIHDFARAYGSLCWNLSKVIPKKDLPRIYTMCLPSPYRNKPSDEALASADDRTLGSGMADLEATREEVVSEVFKAPFRRVDNEIQRLSDSLHVLHMHLRVVDEMVKKYRSHLWSFRATVAGTLGLAGALSGGALTSMPVEIGAAVTGVSTLAFLGVQWFQQQALEDEIKTITNETSVQGFFKHLYSKQIAENDEFIASIWPRVHQHITMTIRPSELKAMSRVSSSEMGMIDRILEIDIAQLRKKILPKF